MVYPTDPQRTDSTCFDPVDQPFWGANELSTKTSRHIFIRRRRKSLAVSLCYGTQTEWPIVPRGNAVTIFCCCDLMSLAAAIGHLPSPDCHRFGPCRLMITDGWSYLVYINDPSDNYDWTVGRSVGRPCARPSLGRDAQMPLPQVPYDITVFMISKRDAYGVHRIDICR